MPDLRYHAIRFGLEGFWLTGAHLMARPFLGGVGAILTLHQVSPDPPPEFAPNRILGITPDFLDAVIKRVRKAGLDLVDLDEARRRLTTPGTHRRFVALTFDDGYRDNLVHALPVLKRNEVPATIYLATALTSGKGTLWWKALEEIIASRDAIAVPIEGERRHFACDTLERKEEAFREIYWWLRSLDPVRQGAAVRDLTRSYGFDAQAQCRALIMGWDEVVEMAREPLITFGAHTIDHVAVASVGADEARRQIRVGGEVMASHLGARPRHFSFPYGSPCAAGPRDFAIARELGFATAVTTRPGVLYPEHAEHLTALPRVSLNGEYQSLRYLDVLLSGLPFFVLNRFGRLNVA